MNVRQDEDVVRFVLIEETGPRDVLLFSCKTCPDSKLTSHQLEYHMGITHNSRRFTVELPKPVRTSSRKSTTS
jgi:hypothetical protein